MPVLKWETDYSVPDWTPPEPVGDVAAEIHWSVTDDDGETRQLGTIPSSFDGRLRYRRAW